MHYLCHWSDHCFGCENLSGCKFGTLRRKIHACPVSTTPFTLTAAALQVPPKGVLSDHELCTVLGERVLRDHGSSVDAAIAGALCLGVVHPHVSGVGGYVTDVLWTGSP